MSEVSLRRQFNLVEARPLSGITLEALYDLLIKSFHYTLRSRKSAEEMRTSRRFGNTNPMKFQRRDLCQIIRGAPDGAVVFPAGLLHRASDIFKKCDVAWTLEDLRPQLLPAPNFGNMELDKLRDRDDQMKCLATIFASDMGVISGPTGMGKTFMIGQICRAYPEANIIICTYRGDVVSSIYERLRNERHVPARELGRVGKGFRSPKRVTVSTIGSLERCNLDACRLFLYDECHEAGSEDRQVKIGGIKLARRFGFSANPQDRSDGSSLAIEAMFGPIIYETSYQEGEEAGRLASITVKVVRVPGAPIPYEAEIAKYRHGIWRNEYRNQLISREAQKYADEGKQVLIMVDKVEHAFRLKKFFLPDWPVVHGLVSAEQLRLFRSWGIIERNSWLCTAEQREAYRKRFEQGKMRFAIATGVWSQGVDFVHLDVLARGDAMSGAIKSTQIPGRLARGKEGLLVDFDDTFDEFFRKKSQRRFQTYASKGWKIERV